MTDQKRLEAESHAAIGETEHLIPMLAAGGFPARRRLGVLACQHRISRPIAAMCKAMRELAGGNGSTSFSPGLGRKDELGEMAGAVEEFKLQAIARAERDAPRRKRRTRRRAPRAAASLFALPTNSRSAVGAIVSNVSASAGASLEGGGGNADADG